MDFEKALARALWLAGPVDSEVMVLHGTSPNRVHPASMGGISAAAHHARAIGGALAAVGTGPYINSVVGRTAQQWSIPAVSVPRLAPGVTITPLSSAPGGCIDAEVYAQWEFRHAMAGEVPMTDEQLAARFTSTGTWTAPVSTGVWLAVLLADMRHRQPCSAVAEDLMSVLMRPHQALALAGAGTDRQVASELEGHLVFAYENYAPSRARDRALRVYGLWRTLAGCPRAGTSAVAHSFARFPDDDFAVELAAATTDAVSQYAIKAAAATGDILGDV